MIDIGKHRALAIVGIHTGIGKTVVSAALVQALDAAYWKPVQSGLEERDSETVAALTGVSPDRILPERYLLRTPVSPHEAARLDGITMQLSDFRLPATDRLLLVETAGGVMSPLTDDRVMADFVKYLDLPAILVVRHYLGSINHTLSALECLRFRGVDIKGVVVSGGENHASEEFIVRYGGVKIIGRIPDMTPPGRNEVWAAAQSLSRQWGR
jgi:dethiobiotin synthetase